MIKQEDITGGELSDIPNDKYKKFFEKFEEINNLNVSEWKVTHILSYFCKKYFDTYQVKYKFKFNSPAPSKCFEVFQIKKLSSMLSAKPKILKDYIDWVFENKVIKTKRRLTSISFMTVEGIVNEYKINVLLEQKNKKIDRNTPLPDEYKNILQSNNLFLDTYGDLAFLSYSEMTDKIVNVFDKLQSLGLDVSVLGKVI